MMRPLLIGLPALLLALAGCRQTPDQWISPTTRSMAPPAAYNNPALQNVRRVALMPVWGDTQVRDSERETVQAAVRRSLQTLNAFEIVTVSPGFLEHRYSVDAFSTSAELPNALFAQVREETAADAVMFVEITSISSYPPLALGLKARIESLAGRGTLWAFDYFFDANRPRVAATAKRYNEPGDPSSGSVLLSPSLFSDFATLQMVESMEVKD